ncbi:MAG: ABC transporter substrate-binding protein [Actinobacteria bacterium]|nr:ABC transporter substrate-binding protein [Actinomycetota bacterium]MBV8563126.1 ABC transporter substrate-binding protein [Actinomycetota bacterium]
MTGRTRARIALGIVSAAALVLAASAAARVHAASPIVIGWAHDSTGPMAPFDGPALAAAQIRVKQINAKGGVLGHPLQIQTCDTQGDKPTVSKACADKLIAAGAQILFTTCDVDLAAPAVQEGINKGLLTVAPCIGTDQMGPKRFGAKGKLAFSFGNVAQDEGSAMAQFAWSKGWKTADLATDSVIVYFKNVVQAFKARFTELGGKIVDEETYQDPVFHGNNVQNAVSRINQHQADVVVTSTAGAWNALAPLINGLRTLGNQTPVLNSWAGDGTYWLPKSPAITNYYFVTYANAFGQDPSAAINTLAKQVKAGTGGFITGPAAIDGVVTAIKEAKGSTDGATLAALMEKFHNVPTISGNVSFSPKLHSVFGRAYRIVEINNNTPKELGTITAKVVPTIR